MVNLFLLLREVLRQEIILKPLDNRSLTRLASLIFILIHNSIKTGRK